MSKNPYVQYGVGLRKVWGERFVGFVQTYLMSGGRNGVGFHGCLRFALGADGKGKVKGETPKLETTKVSLNYKK